LDFRLVIAIALVLVLFSSAYSLDAFAVYGGPSYDELVVDGKCPPGTQEKQRKEYDHTKAEQLIDCVQVAEPEIPSGKSAYVFDCSGAGGKGTGNEGIFANYVLDNNGHFHRCAFNWINAGEKATGAVFNDREPKVRGERIPHHDPAVDNSIRNNKHDGKFVDHTENQLKTPCAWCRGNPYGWIEVLHQFDAIFPLVEQSNNAKLILRGFSWGGGTVAPIASNQRCTCSGCDTALAPAVSPSLTPDPRIQKDIPSFLDTTFDLIWLVDPVGSQGARGTLTHTNGIEGYQNCGLYKKVFGSNVKQVLTYFQPYGGGGFSLPIDVGSSTGFDKDVQIAPFEEHWVGGYAAPDFPQDKNLLKNPVDPLDPGDETCQGEYRTLPSGVLVRLNKRGYDEKGNPGHPFDCHGGINDDTEKVSYNRAMAFMKSMNGKPIFEEVPETIRINPGESFKVQAYDKLTRWDDDHNPFPTGGTGATLKFRLSPATPDELHPIPGSEITVNTNRIVQGSSWTLVENPGFAKQFDVNILNTQFTGIPIIDIVALGEDNAVQRRTWNGGTWLDWGIIGDSNNPILAKEMFVSKNLDGKSREVWAIDNDGAVQRKFWTGPPVPFSFGGFAEKIVATSVDDKYKVWVIDSDGAVRHKWRDLGTSWQPGNGKQEWDNFSDDNFAKEIFVTKNLLGINYDVWIIDNDGVVKRKGGLSHNWSGWESLGGSAEQIFVTTNDFGTRYDVWILSSNNDVQHKWWDGTSWSEWESLGIDAKEIFVTTNPLGTRNDVFVIDSNGAVQHQLLVNNIGSGWELVSNSNFATEIVVTPDFGGAGNVVWVIDNDGAVQYQSSTSTERGIFHTAEFYNPIWTDGIYTLELIVEDNGWPCGNCTSLYQNTAKGALGHYDIKTITLIVGGGGGDDDPEDPLGPWDPLDPNDPRNMRIPSWIKFIAEQWSKGLIGDAEFANAIRFLVNSNVIVIPDLPEAGQADRDDIPQWIKFNAEQWANGALSDTEFVSGIKWIIENGIIQLN